MDWIKSKAQWTIKLHIEMFESGKSIHELWDTFKTELLQTINENI